MDSAKLNDWMQVVGIFALVASLIFVGMQMQQDRTLAGVEALSSRADNAVALADLIGNNKVVWVGGLNGDELSETDHAAFQAMVEAVEKHFVAYWVRLGSIGGGRLANDVVGDYAFAIYSHTGFRRAWTKQNEYRQIRNNALGVIPASPFGDRVNSALAQLDKDAPPLPAENHYIFW